jgi:hypothetical protein
LVVGFAARQVYGRVVLATWTLGYRPWWLYLFYGVLIAAVYVVPSVVAWDRKVANAGSVYVVNLLLGWSFVGWVVALAMAVRSRSTD